MRELPKPLQLLDFPISLFSKTEGYDVKGGTMSNPFDTYPSVIVRELKETRQRLEHQMVKYAVFKKVGWDVTECGATSRSDDVLAFACSDDDGFRLSFWDTDHEFRNVSAEDAVAYVKAVERGLMS